MIAGAALLVAAVPTTAQATTVSAQNGRITITTAAGEKNTITVNEGDGSYQITESSAPITAGEGCTKAPDAARVGCPAAGTILLSADLGDGDDSLINSAGVASELTGGAGGDSITGGFGDDVIRGDAGDDTLNGGQGADTLQGADGNDTLDGGEADDTLEGGDGSDSLTGGTGNDTLTAGDGNDALAGGDGNDRLEAGKGADTIEAGAGDDVLLTAEGEFTGTKEKRIRCGPGSDTLTAGPADAFVSDCERTDGASLRLKKGGVIPLALACADSCKGTVRIRDAKNKINAKAPVNLKAGERKVVKLRLTAAEIKRLFRKKKVRLTAAFSFAGGQKVRATFTLLRRV